MSWALERGVIASGDLRQVSASATCATVSVAAIYDCVHRIVGVALRAMRLAAIVPLSAALEGCIAIIRGAVAKKQMPWPNTWTNVAVVQHPLALWDGSEMKFPREAMRGYQAAIRSCECSIVAAGAIEPEPTGRSLRYALPESVYFGSFLRCHELGVV